MIGSTTQVEALDTDGIEVGYSTSRKYSYRADGGTIPDPRDRLPIPPAVTTVSVPRPPDMAWLERDGMT